MPPLQLPVGSNIARDKSVASARLINAYVEVTGNDAKSQYVLYASPGLERWDNGSFTGAWRGGIELDDFTLISLLGNEVVQSSQSGATTKLGSLIGSDRVIMTKNRADPIQIVMIVGSQAYTLTDGVVALVTDGDLPPVNSADYLRGRVLYGVDDGRVFCSANEDATSIAALATDSANTRADGLVRVKEHAGFAYFMGRQSIEIWAADPSLAGQPFPFSPVQQNIAIGLAAKHSVVDGTNGMLWVDDENFVRYGRDSSAAAVSNKTVERAIESLSEADRENLVGMTYTHQGHQVYVLKSASWTWELDFHAAAAFGFDRAWRERKSYGSDTWQVNGIIRFGGKEIAGRSTDGELFEIDSDAYDEAGEELVMEIWCPYSHRFPRSAIIDQLKLDAIVGVGLQSGGLDVTDPHLMIDFSDNGGRTFEGEELIPLGQIGEYSTEIETYQWGLMEAKGRIWRFRVSAAVLRGIMAANIEARPAA